MVYNTLHETKTGSSFKKDEPASKRDKAWLYQVFCPQIKSKSKTGSNACHAMGVEELLGLVGTGCQPESYAAGLGGAGRSWPALKKIVAVWKLLCRLSSPGGPQGSGSSSSDLRMLWEGCFLQHPGTAGDSCRARLLSSVCVGKNGEVGMQLPMKGHMASVDSVALEGLVVSGDSDVLSGLVASHGCLLARNRASHALLSSWVCCGVLGRPQDGPQ